LCGFGGRQIVALGKITISITFGYVHNTRIEQVVFDIVDMDYPYNAIIGRGTLNAFEAIVHLAYLCMKKPSDQGPYNAFEAIVHLAYLLLGSQLSDEE
jgi:deoxyxylulose-5-phosphate synthase